jgi:hypothetical protein
MSWSALTSRVLWQREARARPRIVILGLLGLAALGLELELRHFDRRAVGAGYLRKLDLTIARTSREVRDGRTVRLAGTGKSRSADAVSRDRGFDKKRGFQAVLGLPESRRCEGERRQDAVAVNSTLRRDRAGVE